MRDYSMNSGTLVEVKGLGGGKTIYKPSHQACSDTPIQPNYVFFQRTTALPSVWSGSETFVDFELPQTLGIVDQLIVRFQLNLAFTGGSSPSITLPPTSFWCSRIEEYIGNDLLATTYANEQYNEGMRFFFLNRVFRRRRRRGGRRHDKIS